MKLGITLITLVLLLSYTPAPVVQPGDPFVFDPNSCPSPAMGAFVVPVGTTYNGEFDVYESDGENVTVTADKIRIGQFPVTVNDPNDPLGLAVKHTYKWWWSPQIADVGLHYVNVTVTDIYNAKDERTIVLLAKENKPPVFTGCR